MLYGCGDLVDDYEGISGYEEYRDDLRVLYRADVRADTGELESLAMRVLVARRLRLEPASAADVAWLARTLDGESRRFGSRISADRDGLHLSPVP